MSQQVPSDSSNSKISLATLQDKKDRSDPIVAVTAYDYPTARVADAAGVDLILVGDSLAMVVLGYENTLPVTMDEMLHHCRAVARGSKRAFMTGDMPFLSYQVDVSEAVRNAGRFLSDAGMDSVKLEGGRRMASTVRAIVEAGIPVMGIPAQVLVSNDLLGLFDRFTPRFVKKYSNLRAEMLNAFERYRDEVGRRDFPGAEHTFGIPDDEWQTFIDSLEDLRPSGKHS